MPEFKRYKSGGLRIPADMVRLGDVIMHHGIPKVVDWYHQEGWCRFVGVRLRFLDGTETYLEAHEYARTCIPGIYG